MHSVKSRLLVALLSTVASGMSAGCSSDDGNPGADATGGTPGTGGTTGGGNSPGTGGSGIGGNLSTSNVSFDGTTFTASITQAHVVPGGQDHVCVTVELPNTAPVWISSMRATLTPGSHHLIVDRTAGSPQTVPSSCFPTMGGDESRLIIGQQADSRVDLPSGVALPLAAHQPIFLQLHYANPEADFLDITGTVELTVYSGSAPPIEAKSDFTGSFAISIPPQSPGTSNYFFNPTPSTGTRHIFALTSHTHKLGVRATIERVPNATAPATTPIHESLNWSEPPLTLFNPTLDFTGSDGLRLTCYYQNTTNQTVTFGTNVENEMCFMWVYYYDQ